MNLLETFSKLVNEDNEQEEDEEVRNKMLGLLEFLAIKNKQCNQLHEVNGKKPL